MAVVAMLPKYRYKDLNKKSFQTKLNKKLNFFKLNHIQTRKSDMVNHQ